MDNFNQFQYLDLDNSKIGQKFQIDWMLCLVGNFVKNVGNIRYAYASTHYEERRFIQETLINMSQKCLIGIYLNLQ